MSWETLAPVRGRRVQSEWAVVVAKTGIRIWLPHTHRLAAAPRIETQIGKGEHRGLLRLCAGPAGRMVIRGKSGAPYLIYSSLPFAPALLPLTALQAIDNADGSTDLVLPWKPVVRTVEVA